MRFYDNSQRELFAHEPSSDALRKLCPKCGKIKPLPEFAKRRADTSQPCSYCRQCQREYCRQHYRNHCSLHNSRRYKRQKSERAEIAERLREYKRTRACADCGETDPIVLEFDHVRGTKVGEVGAMVRCWTWQAIVEEIAKCELRCANCHRRKTAKQLGWKIW